MTTVLALAKRALQARGAIGDDEDPSASEGQTCLEVFQSLILSLFPRKMTDVLIDAAYEIGENERVGDTSDGAVAITFPTTITDAATGEARMPYDGAIGSISGSPHQRYIWISDRGAWMPLTGLALTSDSPLTEEFDNALLALLAMHLPRFGSLPPEIPPMAEAGRSAIRARYRQPYTSSIDPVLTRAWRFI